VILVRVREPWFLPNWHPFFQFIDHPLRGGKRRAAMPGRDPQKERRLTRAHKTNPVMNDRALQLEFGGRFFRNTKELVLGHRTVRFVFDPFDFAVSFKARTTPLNSTTPPADVSISSGGACSACSVTKTSETGFAMWSKASLD